MKATLRHIYLCWTAIMSCRTCVVIKQIQSNPIQLDHQELNLAVIPILIRTCLFHVLSPRSSITTCYTGCNLVPIRNYSGNAGTNNASDDNTDKTPKFQVLYGSLINLMSSREVCCTVPFDPFWGRMMLLLQLHKTCLMCVNRQPQAAFLCSLIMIDEFSFVFIPMLFITYSFTHQ